MRQPSKMGAPCILVFIGIGQLVETILLSKYFTSLPGQDTAVSPPYSQDLYTSDYA